MQKLGKQQIFGHKHKTANFDLNEVRQYSELYQAADEHYRTLKVTQRAERAERIAKQVAKQPLYDERRAVMERRNELLDKRREFGISEEEQKELDGCFARLKQIGRNPVIKKDARNAKLKRLGTELEKELQEQLYDSDIIPKRAMELADKYQTLNRGTRQNPRFVIGGVSYTFVKNSYNVLGHWSVQRA